MKHNLRFPAGAHICHAPATFRQCAGHTTSESGHPQRSIAPAPDRLTGGISASEKVGIFLPVPDSTGGHSPFASENAGAICLPREGHASSDATASTVPHAMPYPAVVTRSLQQYPFC